MTLRKTAVAAALLLTSSLLFAQRNTPIAAPGLNIPGGSLPYALDKFEGKPQLVPIHRSTIELNSHKGANVAGSLAGSVFYKPKMTTELAGPHARTTLHDLKPVIYLHMMQDDPDGQGGDGGATLALVRATVNGDRRVFARMQFTQLTGNARRKDGVIETTTELLPNGWVRLTPVEPLTPGEYAVTPIPHAQNAYATVVYDFQLDPAGANAADAVKPDSRDAD